MNQLTLVLPFALPVSELAKDLIRALQAPALAALLSRTTSQTVTAVDNAARILPHEAWLAHALGLGTAPSGLDAGAAFARAAMRGYGLAPDAGYWFLVHPIHVQIARNHLLMGDQRQLSLDDAEARALFDAAQPYFDEIGKLLLYGDARTWFVRADDWADLATASPDAATGQNLSAWMPEGGNARATRKLQNEVQMLWHAHAVNQARQERGQAPVNSFWLWGGAATPAQASDLSLFTAEAPSWLAALAEPRRRAASLDNILGERPDRALAVLGQLAEAGIASDWASWLTHMQELELTWFAPLLAALKDGRIGQLTLVMSNRDAYAEFSSSKNAQRKFWRAPSLNRLST